ncbi:hypothetical protein [Cohnella sp. GbtcB17]|uniref:hypothetical protein n=1 Tax=Cohnella sp. GbtcB17 TaxID=2824762 RepID=UPI001C2F6794|nr:hypothetical protein [Cohnella sp. GbtcB17]
MSNQELYDATVREEDRLSRSLDTWEEAGAALCHWVFKFGEALDTTIISELLTDIAERQKETYTQIMLIRLKKAELTRTMNDHNDE